MAEQLCGVDWTAQVNLIKWSDVGIACNTELYSTALGVFCSGKQYHTALTNKPWLTTQSLLIQLVLST